LTISDFFQRMVSTSQVLVMCRRRRFKSLRRCLDL